MAQQHTSVFVSHSSADRDAAVRIAQRLKAAGCGTYFLDFDPEQGIEGGSRWEDELYQRLRASRSVLLLWSAAAAASRWVFAEVAIAKALGKKVIPGRLDATALDTIISPLQAVDLTTGDDGLDRLVRALDDASSWSGADAFAWNQERSPYPGLSAMQREDAGVFFGRDEVVEQLEERLRSLRRVGAGKLLVVVGPSGSGKSSVIRAGLLPRLERQPEWLVVPAFRPHPSPGVNPFDELAGAIASRFPERRVERSTRIVDQLRTAADGCEALRAIAEELNVGAGRRDSLLLLVLDQLEELLAGGEDGEPPTQFLQWLAQLSQKPGAAAIIATMRSDYLPDLQRHPAAHDLAVELFTLAPLGPESWSQIIEGPAARAGALIERALTDRLVRDVGSDESLPLLANMLERLWRKRSGGQLTLAAYEREGGLEKSIATAAEDVWGAVPLTAEEAESARRTFASLVAIGQGDRFIRKSASWSDVPPVARPLIARFEDERLVVPRDGHRGREIELAHDALIRSWERLRGWLEADRDFLAWRTRLSQRAHQRKDGDVLRGGALREAMRWMDDLRASALSSEERTLLDESITEHRRSVSRVLITGSEYLRGGRIRDLPVSAALAVEALRTHVSQESVRQVQTALRLLPRQIAVHVHDAAVTAVACSPDGHRFATGDKSGQVCLMDLRGNQQLTLTGHRDYIWRILFAPNGMLVTASSDRTARVWDSNGQLVARLEHDDAVVDLQIDPTGSRLLTVSGLSRLGGPAVGSAMLRTWDLVTGRAHAKVFHDALVGARFSPDGQLVVSGGNDRRLLLWNAQTGEVQAGVGGDQDLVSFDVQFVEQGIRFLVRRSDGSNGRVALLSTRENALHEDQHWPAGPIGPVLLGSGGWVGFASDNSFYLFDGRTGCQTHRFIHQSLGGMVVTSPDERLLATTEFDGVFRVWSMQSGEEVARITTDHALDFAFSSDGRTLITTGPGREAHVWDLARAFDPIVERRVGAGARALFSAAGDLIVMSGTPFRPGENLMAPKISLVLGVNPVSAEVVGEAYCSGMVRSLDVSPDGRFIVVGSAGRALVFEPRTSDDAIVLPYEDTAAAAFLGPAVVVARGSGDVHLWDCAARRELASASHGGAVHALAAAASGDRFAVSGDGSGVSIFAGSSLTLVRRLAPRGVPPPDDGRLRIPAARLAFDPTIRLLAVHDVDHELWVWALNANEPVVRQPFEPGAWLSAFAFSMDGNLIGIATRSPEVDYRSPGRVRIVDTRSGAIVSVREFESAATCLAFHPRERVIASGHEDGRVLVWSHVSGNIEQEMRLGGAVNTVAFSPDASMLLTGAQDDFVRMGLVGQAGLLAEAERRLTRTLTPEERLKFVPELSLL